MDIVIQQTKFHRILLKKFKISKLNKKEITIRNLLCYYQELACKKYNQEDKMLFFLQDLYDAKFKVRVIHYGTYSLLEYSLECVNPLYIKEDTYTIEVLVQAFEELTIPYMNSKQADSKLFLRAFEIYQSDLYSYKDDYEMLAFEQAVQSYFEGTSRDFSKMGTEAQLKEISLEDLYQYYFQVQKEEEITMITGNVPLIALNEKQKITPKDNFQFKERKNIKNNIHHPLSTKQCYLEVIFDHQIFADDPLYASMIVLNYIFGGGQFSRLFCDVREKLGLCYSISSSYLVTSGILVVSCSTEKQKIEQVLTSINQVFESLLENISLKEVKESILALKTEEQDYIETAIYTYLTKHYFLDYLSIEEEIEAIKKVSLTTLKQAYQKMKCSLVYTLGGDADV